MNNIIRKRVVITVEEKLKTIKELDASKLVAVMAKEYGVGQVMGGGGGDWRRNRKNMKQWRCKQVSLLLKENWWNG